MGAALVFTINRMVYASFYVNGHILVAAAVLIVAAGGWMLVVGPRYMHRPLIIGMALSVASVTVARPDAVALMAILLVPTLLCSAVKPLSRAVPLIALGLMSSAWYGFSIIRHHEIGVPTPSAAKGFFLLGLVALAAVPLLYWNFLTRNRMLFVGLVEAAVWFVAAAAAIRAPRVVRASIEATWENMVLGAGGWSVSLILTAAILIAALIVFRHRGAESMRYAVTTFFPLVIIFAVARGPAYRVGGGDSLNRSWTHIVAVAVVLLVTTVAVGVPRFAKPTNPSTKEAESALLS